MLSHPFVVRDELSNWTCSQWTPASLAEQYTDRVTFRIGRRSAQGVQFEGQCVYVDATLHEFVSWIEGRALSANPLSANPLSAYSRDKYWCYADYKHMNQMFAGQKSLLKAVDWSLFGLDHRTGEDSTFWLGSAGAYTVCHYDTYGWNLVAQIAGRKRWTLFPPCQSACLYPTRIPYEESSVFSQVDVKTPDTRLHPRFVKATPTVIDLGPGDLLYVPHHWWHHVECLETAISVNTWVETPADVSARLQEAVTRTLVCGSMQDLNTDWLNPTESEHDMEENFGLLNTSLSAAMAPTQSCDLQLSKFTKTLTERNVNVTVGEVCTYREYVDRFVTESMGRGQALGGGEGCQFREYLDRYVTEYKDSSIKNPQRIRDGKCEANKSVSGDKRGQNCDGEGKRGDDGVREKCRRLEASKCTETSENRITGDSDGPFLETTRVQTSSISKEVDMGDMGREKGGRGEEGGREQGLSYQDIVNCFVDREVVSLVCDKLRDRYKRKHQGGGEG